MFFSSIFYAGAQSVAINNDGSAVSDPKAMLEVKKMKYAKLKIRSTSYSDTAVMELSNRDILGLGTDFLFSQYGERGLVISSKSDLAQNESDSIMTFSPKGVVSLKSLKGTNTQPVYANSSGELIRSPQTYIMNVGASAFQPTEGNNYANFIPADGNIMASFSAGSNAYAIAHVNLPDGATVISMKAYYVDNSSANITFRLSYADILLNGSNSLADITSTGNSGNMHQVIMKESTTISYSKINNSRYAYYVRCGASPSWDGFNLRIKAVVITYTL